MPVSQPAARPFRSRQVQSTGFSLLFPQNVSPVKTRQPQGWTLNEAVVAAIGLHTADEPGKLYGQLTADALNPRQFDLTKESPP